MKKITTQEIEVALANFINPRVNLVVPNVSWGFFNHECDMLAVSKSGYATEYEIKISKADLKADFKKEHGHTDHRIKALYYVMPHYMKECADLIPEEAGIIFVQEETTGYMRSNGERYDKVFLGCRIFRHAVESKTPYKFTDAEKFQIARLGAMRIWGMKEKLNKVSGVK